MVDEQRWLRLMDQLSLPESLDTYQQLWAAYTEPQRFYHTVEHISDCLQQLDQVAHLAQSAAAVELSLWFHDAVYQPKAQDNEVQSAAWAVRFLQLARDAVNYSSLSKRISQQILATQHQGQSWSGDTALVVDIDLSILGRESEQFQRFEQNIRREYLWVPEPIYRQKRSAILRSFLEHPKIFETEFFQDRYEEPARQNLITLIKQLER